MSTSDIRWIQRLDNYRRALSHLQEAAELMDRRELSRLEKQGVIQAFEFSWELAWKLMKDYLEWQGITGLAGARDATREAFRQGLLSDGEVWMAMLQDRNRTAHTYNESTMLALLEGIQSRYVSELAGFADRMQQLAAAHER